MNGPPGLLKVGRSPSWRGITPKADACQTLLPVLGSRRTFKIATRLHHGAPLAVESVRLADMANGRERERGDDAKWTQRGQCKRLADTRGDKANARQTWKGGGRRQTDTKGDKASTKRTHRKQPAAGPWSSFFGFWCTFWGYIAHLEPKMANARPRTAHLSPIIAQHGPFGARNGPFGAQDSPQDALRSSPNSTRVARVEICGPCLSIYGAKDDPFGAQDGPK